MHFLTAFYIATLALAPAAHAGEISVSQGGEAVVTVASSKGTLTVAEITGRAVATSGYSTATAVGWRDLCTTPCELKVPSGLHEISVYGAGYLPATVKVDFKAGTTTKLEAHPAGAGFRTLALGLLVGGTAAITGGVLGMNQLECGNGNGCTEVTQPWAVPLIATGSVMAAGGITFYITPQSKIVVVPG